MSKHVTFARMNVQPGKIDELTGMMSGAREEARLKDSGWQGTVVGASKSDPNEVWMAVTWDTSENYFKNAESAEQNEMYQKMRALLTADPEWHDCGVIQEERA